MASKLRDEGGIETLKTLIMQKFGLFLPRQTLSGVEIRDERMKYSRKMFWIYAPKSLIVLSLLFLSSSLYNLLHHWAICYAGCTLQFP